MYGRRKTGRYLFGEEQEDALEHLVAVEGRDGHVEEEAVEDGLRDVRQRVRQGPKGQNPAMSHR